MVQREHTKEGQRQGHPHGGGGQGVCEGSGKLPEGSFPRTRRRLLEERYVALPHENKEHWTRVKAALTRTPLRTVQALQNAVVSKKLLLFGCVFAVFLLFFCCVFHIEYCVMSHEQMSYNASARACSFLPLLEVIEGVFFFSRPFPIFNFFFPILFGHSSACNFAEDTQNTPTNRPTRGKHLLPPDTPRHHQPGPATATPLSHLTAFTTTREHTHLSLPHSPTARQVECVCARDRRR